MNIGLAFGQNVPDGDEQFPGDGHNGLLFANPQFEPIEFFLPVSMDLNRSPGRFDQSMAQFPPALFGDTCTACGASVAPVWWVWPEEWTREPRPA